MKIFLTSLLGAFILLFSGLVLLSPIDAMNWTAPDSKAGGVSCNPEAVDYTLKARVLSKELPGNPDGLFMTDKGDLYAALTSGKIIRIDKNTGQWVLLGQKSNAFFAGITVSEKDNKIYVIDERSGELVEYSITNNTAVQPGNVLLRNVSGKKIIWGNDVIYHDDHVYISSTSQKWPMDRAFFGILSHENSGQVIKFNTRTGQSRILNDGLFMPNGIAMTPNGEGVLVGEMSTYRIASVPAEGGKAISIIDNLPGLPGNLRKSDRPGVYWSTFITGRNDIIDRLAPYPVIRELIAWLPRSNRSKPAPTNCLVSIKIEENKVTAKSYLIKADFALPSFSTVLEYQGKLYISPAFIDPDTPDNRVFEATLPK